MTNRQKYEIMKEILGGTDAWTYQLSSNINSKNFDVLFDAIARSTIQHLNTDIKNYEEKIKKAEEDIRKIKNILQKGR